MFKKLETILLCIDLLKTFDSIHRRKMEQILLSYILPKETARALRIFYENTKAMVCSLDVSTLFFKIAAGVLQEDTLVSYMLILCLSYLLQMSID